ncbi:DUF742 domain-containing protein [Actinocorallia populi]|uniref:DUF742 domain-containing protein n=1 Tax=Actinocorallia populi TaxID=2079200 RepID=UPI000D092ACD|nr:DUF742 domain-containing protein [Actinocorallia populi]
MTGHEWLDEEAGPIVRPFTLTGGRTASGHPSGLDLMTLVVRTSEPVYGSLLLSPEHEAILRLAHSPLTVAEVAAELDLAVGVVKVLLGDLLADRHITMRRPAPVAQFPHPRIIEEVIHGLQAL